MPRVTASSDIVAERGTAFNSLLRPLLVNPELGGPGRDRRSLPVRGVTSIVWAAHNGTPTLSYRDWRFPIFVPEFQAQYFEVWIPTDPRKARLYYLWQTYLNIYHNVDEYICLHCDPEEEDTGDAKACYKQSPHLHIKAAHDPIPKAHVALAHDHIDRILASEDDLFRAMQVGIELIRDEILVRI